eukprot:gnl/Spiro4/13717_TR7311_c0_g1_i1.p1 gnl/Spiro4/13717_TR7311_c0_g1~~gnl/Spiro4/13717_TR7311_c0_g1_i1.p1  ORF type:complete len:743 (+),score=157.43 gnl/Spiro4/13717_TR7311_c0_g1_i1:98-2326(+)
MAYRPSRSRSRSRSPPRLHSSRRPASTDHHRPTSARHRSRTPTNYVEDISPALTSSRRTGSYVDQFFKETERIAGSHHRHSSRERRPSRERHSSREVHTSRRSRSPPRYDEFVRRRSRSPPTYREPPVVYSSRRVRSRSRSESPEPYPRPAVTSVRSSERPPVSPRYHHTTEAPVSSRDYLGDNLRSHQSAYEAMKQEADRYAHNLYTPFAVSSGQLHSSRRGADSVTQLELTSEEKRLVSDLPNELPVELNTVLMLTTLLCQCNREIRSQRRRCERTEREVQDLVEKLDRAHRAAQSREYERVAPPITSSYLPIDPSQLILSKHKCKCIPPRSLVKRNPPEYPYYICDGCGASLSGERYNCQYCDYDLCHLCISSDVLPLAGQRNQPDEVRVQVTCKTCVPPKILVKDGSEITPYVCDKCSKSGRGQAYRCSSCLYQLCQPCHKECSIISKSWPGDGLKCINCKTLMINAQPKHPWRCAHKTCGATTGPLWHCPTCINYAVCQRCQQILTATKCGSCHVVLLGLRPKKGCICDKCERRVEKDAWSYHCLKCNVYDLCDSCFETTSYTRLGFPLPTVAKPTVAAAVVSAVPAKATAAPTTTTTVPTPPAPAATATAAAAKTTAAPTAATKAPVVPTAAPAKSTPAPAKSSAPAPTTTVVCHHKAYKSTCGSCKVDGKWCLDLPSDKIVACHHKDFKDHCGKGCIVDDNYCKIVNKPAAAAATAPPAKGAPPPAKGGPPPKKK